MRSRIHSPVPTVGHTDDRLVAEYLLFGAGVTLLNHTEDRFTGHILTNQWTAEDGGET